MAIAAGRRPVLRLTSGRPLRSFGGKASMTRWQAACVNSARPGRNARPESDRHFGRITPERFRVLRITGPNEVSEFPAPSQPPGLRSSPSG
jgi:hypothetical protein